MPLFAARRLCHRKQGDYYRSDESSREYSKKWNKPKALIAQVWVGSEFCFSVMAGLNPAFYENTAVW